VLKLERETPVVKFIVIVAQGINHLDASGVETLRNLSSRLRQSGVTLVIGGVKRQILDIMQRTGLIAAMLEENVFTTERAAIDSVMSRILEHRHASHPGPEGDTAKVTRSAMELIAAGTPTGSHSDSAGR
jgi:MFS superfamily sulfate permease-like transporter